MATDAGSGAGPSACQAGPGKDSSKGCGSVPQRTAVALRYRGNHILVNVDSVYGCTEIRRTSRIPGAPKSVKGLILFGREVVPLISFFEGTSEHSRRERLNQKAKSDDYAVIFSMMGTRFAARVDEPPRVHSEASAIEDTRGNLCHFRKRHIERLFRLCVGRRDTSDQAAAGRQTKGAPRADNFAGVENTWGAAENARSTEESIQTEENNWSTEGNNPGTEENNPGTEENNNNTEPDEALVIDNPCCAT